MVEATHNVQQTQLHASMSRAVSCLAQQQAIKARQASAPGPLLTLKETCR